MSRHQKRTIRTQLTSSLSLLLQFPLIIFFPKHLLQLQSVLNPAAWLVFSADQNTQHHRSVKGFGASGIPLPHNSAPPHLSETLHLTSNVESRHHLWCWSTSTLPVPSTRRSMLGIKLFLWLRHERGTRYIRQIVVIIPGLSSGPEILLFRACIGDDRTWLRCFSLTNIYLTPFYKVGLPLQQFFLW